METSEFLFTNNKKTFTISRKMSNRNNNSASSSNISVDSLENDFVRKTSVKDNGSEDNVDTILVPFYEKDVLMKVPKEQKNKKGSYKQGRYSDEMMMEGQNCTYLVNKQKAKRTTYLEMFRKQLAPHQKVEKKSDKHEIRSISPEVGDTERESIDDTNNPIPEFYNTESYNEIYYEKLMTQELENYLDNSYEELPYVDDVRGNAKSPRDMLIENLRSVSELSHPRRLARRATIDPPLENVNLGGLGPDMERIKPRLDRARSLQRYSEKVRMENRLKIYKRSIQVEKDKKLEKEPSRHRNPGSEREQRGQNDDQNASYLVNKTEQQKSTQVLTKLYLKSKSADVKKSRTVNPKPLISLDKSSGNNKQKIDSNNPPSAKLRTSASEGHPGRAKSSTRNKGINTMRREVPPVHINFMVNVGGVQPSNNLKSLEEKHRLYQEQVKAFKMENRNI